MRQLRIPVLALCTALSLSACGGEKPKNAALPIAAPPPAAVTWAVASANPHATNAGADVLRAGGSAVDAAIAIQSVLGLVEPQSSGFGGGAFMMYYDAESGVISAFDGREIAPASATPDMFLLLDGSPMPFYDAVTSGKSVGIPGAVAMLELVHKQHGVLPWASLFDHAERLADEGFPVSARLSGLLGRFERLAETSSARTLYYTESGTPLSVGSTLKNPAYAETVRRIAAGGGRAFYTGPIAEQIVAAVNEKTGEGTLTMADLAAYAPSIRPTVCGEFRTYEICSMGPPSSGGVTVLQILGLFDRAVTDDMPIPDQWTRYIEASRLAYADRAIYLADPGAMGGNDVSADDIVEALVSPDYLDKRVKLIGATAAESVEAGDPLPHLKPRSKDGSPELPGTSHFSIRDSRGNIVSMTSTVEFAFGSHLMAGGMILNNQLTDFSFQPERDGVPIANAVGPGKKPRSSMSPVIVMGDTGSPVIAIGSPGGPAIIGYVAKTLIAALAYDMALQDAVDYPHLIVPRGRVNAETTMPDDVMAALTAYGYEVTPRRLTSGLYGFRLMTDGSIDGAADTRREGTFLTGTVSE